MTEDEQKRGAELLRSVRVLSSEDHVHDLVEIRNRIVDTPDHFNIIHAINLKRGRLDRLVGLLSTTEFKDQRLLGTSGYIPHQTNCWCGNEHGDD